MPERPRRPNLDERFSLYPMEGEEALGHLLHAEGADDPDENDLTEGEDS